MKRSYIIHGKGLQENPPSESSHKPRVDANPRPGGAWFATTTISSWSPSPEQTQASDDA